MRHLFTPMTLILCFLFTASTVTGLTLEFTADGEAAGDQLGDAAATLDFNGDGFDDIVIGAPASDAGGTSSGKIYIYFGGAGADNISDLEIIGPSGSFFGSAIADAGDVNNDSYTDLIVGAPFYSVIASRAGAAYVFFGGPSPDTAVDLALFGAVSLDYYGTSVTGDIDFNGDNIDDFAIGAYKADYGLFENAGLVAVHYGSAAPDTVADVVLTGGADGERFGFSLASGNFNGDAFGDIAVGAYSFDAWDINLGRAYIFHGGTSPDSLFDYAVGGREQGVFFGFSLDAGNVNSDAFDDLFVGAYGFKVGQADAGKVYLYEGGSSMDTLADYTHSPGNSSADNLGFDVAAGIDINGDLIEDFWAGYPGGDGGVLYFGGSYGVDTALTGQSPGENFGHDAALAATFFGAQKPAIAVGAFAYNSYQGRAYFYLEDNSSGNQPPALDPIGNKTIAAGDNLNFTVSASDPDGTFPDLYTSTPLPGTATFTDNNDGTGSFDWTPTINDTGVYAVTFYASDGSLTDNEQISITVFDPNAIICGDVNIDLTINVSDPVFLINYIFKGGQAPDPLCRGDVNSDTAVNVSDPVYLINYIFKGGDPPIEPCCP